MGSYVYDRVIRKVPPQLPGDPYINAVYESAAVEVVEMFEKLAFAQDAMFIPTADTDGLALWEKMLGLPQQPMGVSLDERRARVSTKLTSRFVFYGKDMRAGIEAITGAPIDSITVDPDLGQATIVLGGSPTQYQLDQVDAYVHEVGLAHYQWIIIGPSGASAFIAGISTPGDIV